MSVDGPGSFWGDSRGHLDPPTYSGGFGDAGGHLDTVSSTSSTPSTPASDPGDHHLDTNSTPPGGFLDCWE